MPLCTHYYGEMDLDESKSLLTSDKFMLEAGQTLVDLYSPKRFVRMQSILLKVFNIDLNQLNHFLPFFVYSQIQSSVLHNGLALPMDTLIWEHARSLNMKLGGVESVYDQLRTLKRISLSYQLKMLSDLAKAPSKLKKQSIKMLGFYLDENILKIYKSGKKQLGKIRKPLLIERNIQMASFILGNSSNSSFYTVGAAHLAGEKGILKMLKKNDCQISPIY